MSHKLHPDFKKATMPLVVWAFPATVQEANMSLPVASEEIQFPFPLCMFDNGLFQKPASPLTFASTC